MDFIKISERELIKLYGGAHNDIVLNMMKLFLSDMYPEIMIWVKGWDNRESSEIIIDLKKYKSAFKMIGMSCISIKMELIEKKLKKNSNMTLLKDDFFDLINSISASEKLIKTYENNIQNK